ncbi:MAG: flippase [Rhodothermus sp.]|nr:flippase [Rhodothermus sp.]
MRPLQLSGQLLARNTLLNLAGQGGPLLIGVVTLPFIIQGLGTDRFGLLALAWMLLGYFTFFDLGLGRATTKFVAEALARGEMARLRCIIWSAVTAQALLGLVGLLLVLGSTSLLIEKVLNIPEALHDEARGTFHLLALAVPIVLISGSFSGALEAAQRFDWLNAVRIPAGISMFVLPLLGLMVGFRLPGIVALLLLARLGSLMAFIVMNGRLFPGLRSYTMSPALLRSLFAFGGWVTVSSVVSPLLVYLDRFLIGSLRSMTALTYYTAPYEIVTRLRLVPSGLVMVLFPVFSALEGVQDQRRLARYFGQAVRYVLLAMGPITLGVVLGAADLLHVWLGADFATRSTRVLQVLALGVLMNSLAYVPYALLQGIGRPDLPARFHLLELPLYVGGAWLLITHEGIVGAAIAWALRVGADALLLFGATFRLQRLNGLEVLRQLWPITRALGLLGITAWGVQQLSENLPPWSHLMLLGLLLSVFAWFAWKRLLDEADREVVRRVLKR